MHWRRGYTLLSIVASQCEGAVLSLVRLERGGTGGTGKKLHWRRGYTLQLIVASQCEGSEPSLVRLERGGTGGTGKKSYSLVPRSRSSGHTQSFHFRLRWKIYMCLTHLLLVMGLDAISQTTNSVGRIIASCPEAISRWTHSFHRSR